MTGELKRSLAALLSVVVVLGSLVLTSAQPPEEKVDLDAVNRIKAEESDHSQVMEMVGYLTDVTGPRLTGSPNLRRAQQYTLDRLHEWGLGNAHLEAWGPFGRGWSLESFTASVVAPAFSS